MIELKEVHKRLGAGDQAALLDGVDLKVSPQSVAVVVGETGAGKTTLINLLTAMTFADSGTIEIFGRDIAKLRRSSVTLMRRKIGIVPQDLKLVDDWTALANVALPLEIGGTHPREALARAAELLGALNLASRADQRTDRLSVGEKQRIALARAFVHEPWLVTLDEPTAHLDSVGVRQVGGLLAQCVASGGAGVVTTNDPRLVSLCLRHRYDVFHLASGQLRRQQSPPHFAARPSKRPNVVPFPIAAGE